jgi:hypothetical protein
VHKFVGAIRRWGWLIDRPEHGHGENCGHNQSEGDIEILAHANRLMALSSEHKEKLRFWRFAVKAKEASNQGLGGSDKLNICVIKIINNLLYTYDNYTEKYKTLLNFFNKATFQVKD